MDVNEELNEEIQVEERTACIKLLHNLRRLKYIEPHKINGPFKSSRLCLVKQNSPTSNYSLLYTNHSMVVRHKVQYPLTVAVPLHPYFVG